jgi:hypothetical protein
VSPSVTIIATHPHTQAAHRSPRAAPRAPPRAAAWARPADAAAPTDVPNVRASQSVGDTVREIEGERTVREAVRASQWGRHSRSHSEGESDFAATGKPLPMLIPKQLGVGFNETGQHLCFEFQRTLK